ncbi:MAG: DNA internalization-related competence protein ComEC/Rec2 [Vicinamibacterales bacterium]
MRSLPAMSFLPVVVAAALVLGAASGLAWPAASPAGAAIAVCGLLLAWRASAAGWPRVLLVAVVAGTAACGLLLGAQALARLQASPLVAVWRDNGGDDRAAPLDLDGVILADASAGGGRVSFPLRVERVRASPCGCVSTVSGDVLVTIGGDAASGQGAWRAGRHVRVTATLRPVTTFRNPGAESAARALVRRRLALVASVKSRWLVEVTAPGAWHDELAAAARARTRLALARAAGAGSDAAAVATAVLIGDRAGLSAVIEDRLQRAGTFHVIAISGGNVAVWALVALAIAGRVTRHRIAGLVAAAAALVAYAAIVGGGASVLRATGMALVGIACQAADLRGASINVLALTAGVLVAVDPPLALDVGFWLTTAATAGLVVGLPASPAGASRVQRLLHALVVTSVWAELALLPIAASVFQQITVAGVLLSAIAIPAMAVVQVVALAAVVVDVAASWALPLAGAVLRLATAAVTESSALVDVWTWLWWHVPPPSSIAIVAYYALLAAWVRSRRASADTWLAERVRRVTLVALPLAAAWIAAAPWTLVAAPPSDLRLTLIDVGQGDAALIELPGGRRMVVDAGGAGVDGRDLGHRVVAPALRAMGVRRLDYVVVTHADADHLGGAASLVREFRPAEVWVGVPVQEHTPTAALRAAATATGAVWREARAGDRLEAGGVAIDVRHPPPPEWQRLKPRNDDSVVLDLRWRGVRVLLTGDAGADVEATLASAAGPVAPLAIMKLGHHGSRTSTSEAWLAAIRPWEALVSVGATNPFGHPAREVLARLGAAGVDVWRTDVEGAITVRTDGRGVTLTAMSGRARVIAAPDQPR